MSYKVSKFNVPFKKNSEAFLYNSHTGNFVKLNENYQGSLAKINQQRYVEIPEQHIKDLLEAGFIVDINKDENALYEYLNNIQRYGDNGLQLTIATTLQCNFRCPYCYEEHVDEYIEGEKEELLIDFIKKNVRNKKYLSIMWYGGEPLLKKDLILRVSKVAIDLCTEMNIPYHSTMVSNGYLLNRKVAERLVSEASLKSVQITLDGGPKTHNLTRILRNGQGTFDVILKNIKEIHDLLRVNIRVNVTNENVVDVCKIFPILINEGLNRKVGIYFAPVSAYNEVCQSVSESCLITREFSKWETELINYADEIGFEIGNLYPKNRGGSICQAVVKNAYVVDAYGDLFKCWHEVGNKKLRVGSLKEGITNGDRLLTWMNWKMPTKCDSCNIMPLCKGRCPELSLEMEDFECHQLRFNIKDRLFRYYQKTKQDKNKVRPEEILEFNN